jgi:ribosomal protein S4
MNKRSVPKYKKCYQSKKFIWTSLFLNNKIHKFNSRKWSIIKRNLEKDESFFREPFIKRFHFFYSTNLQLKRLLKNYFCGFKEKKFKSIYIKSKSGSKSKTFLLNIDSCLDSVLLKTGLFSSIYHVRFYIRYIGVKLNGNKINISKTILKEGDFVSILPDKSFKVSKIKSYLQVPSKINFINNESFEFDYSTLSFIFLKPSFSNKNILDNSVLNRINFFYNK